MFDTMTLTKIVGSLCGALLIFLMGNWAAELLYDTSGGHGEHATQSYLIETDEAHSSGAEGGQAEDDNMAALMAAADPEKGAKVFGKCKACHKLEDGVNATGPSLYDVVGREVSSEEGFGYSGKLKPVVDVWTPDTLSAFLKSPKGFAPGTSMGFAGLKKATDRANLIAYLDQLDGDIYEMEAPAPTEEDEAAAEPAAEAETEMAAADEPAGIAAMVAAADPAKGEKVFKKCKACHKLEDGENGVGPHLFNLIDRDIASVEGFNFSNVLADIEGNWTAEQLDAFLAKPKEFAPGTKMSFAGLKKEKDRAAVIAYIQSAGQ